MKKLLATAAIALVGTFGAPLVANAQHVNQSSRVIPVKLEITGPSGNTDLYQSPASSQAREDLRIEPVIAATVSPKVQAEWQKMRKWGHETWSTSQAMMIDKAQDRQPYRDYDSASRPAA